MASLVMAFNLGFGLSEGGWSAWSLSFRSTELVLNVTGADGIQPLIGQVASRLIADWTAAFLF